MSGHDYVMKIKALSAIEPTWQVLFKQTPDATPFISYEWFSCLARNLLKADLQVQIVEKNSTVICIIPASITGGVLRSIGDDRVTDLSGMLYVPAHEDAIIRCFAEYVTRNNLAVDLHPLEENNPLVTGLRRVLPHLTVQEKDRSPRLNLPGTWDEYLADMDSKARHEIRRKLNRVNGILLEDVKAEHIDEFFKLMSRSDEKKKLFLTEDTVSFFKDLTMVFGEKGWLRMRRSVLKGRVLGMILAFSAGRSVYLFNMGFDPEVRSLSPGIVTLALDIREAIEDNYRYYDFLRGDEDYKFRLGAKERCTVRMSG